MAHGERKHALLSASGASRWMACPPSARLEENETDRSSSYANEGTLAHEFGDIDLRLAIGEIDHGAHLKRVKELELDENFSDEMQDYVDVYTTYVLSQVSEKRAKLWVEQKIDLTQFIEEGFGTGDAVLLSDRELEVVDLKYGKGIRVSAIDNSQLKLYGLGALRKAMLMYDIDNVRITVVQPRLDHISTWVISADDLLAWGEGEVKAKAKLAYAGGGETKAGDHCVFCKVKHKCPALYEEGRKIAEHDFANPNTIGDDEILEVFNKTSLLSSWLKSVSEYVVATALDGKKWDGYKVVEGRSRRTITDPDAASKILLAEGYAADEVFVTKLKGIGALEKLTKKAKFEELLGGVVVKPPGKPALVPNDDKRQAIVGNRAKDDFC